MRKRDREEFIGLAIDLVRGAAGEPSPAAIRRFKRRRRRVRRALKVAALMSASAIVIPIAMITAGLLFGPRGVEGLIATPLSVIATWAAILFLAYRKRATPRTIVAADLGALPAQTEEWLDRQRPQLPAAAHSSLDRIGNYLEALGPQLEGLDPQVLEAQEVRRLIGEELPELVRGYRKLPSELRQKPLHGGPSPERQLIDGLTTIDEQLGRLHHRLAQGDLHSLATHQRYLELKYKNDPK
jgi:hypothetical protein